MEKYATVSFICGMIVKNGVVCNFISGMIFNNCYNRLCKQAFVSKCS